MSAKPSAVQKRILLDLADGAFLERPICQAGMTPRSFPGPHVRFFNARKDYAVRRITLDAMMARGWLLHAEAGAYEICVATPAGRETVGLVIPGAMGATEDAT